VTKKVSAPHDGIGVAWMAGTSAAMTPSKWFDTTGTRSSARFDRIAWSFFH